MERKEQARILRAKARLLWRLILDTPGTADLEEPLRRVERDFEKLTRDQRTTLAILVTEYEKGAHGIQAAEANQSEAPTPAQASGNGQAASVVIPAEDVEVIPPGGREAAT